MKAGEKTRVSTVRLALSALKNREIELKRELTDEEIWRLIGSLVKQTRESIRLFQEGNRDDLVVKGEEEVIILQSFLPQQLSREEVETKVEEAVAHCGAVSMKDMGKVMKFLMGELGGRVEGKALSEIVKAKLSEG